MIHSKDESFWEVPNALNSYYAGLAAADMSVGTSRSILAWGCASEDDEYMQGFIDATKFTGKLVKFTRVGTSICGGRVATPILYHSRVVISACQKWCDDLSRNFNVIPNKTHRLRPPNLTTDYLKCCYLIGLFDGDGAISHYLRARPIIAYGSASKDIVEWVQQFVESRFPFQIRLKPQVVRTLLDGRYHHYTINGMVAAKLIEFFRTIDVPHFARKWDNPLILQIIDKYRVKWPEFFTPDKELAFDSAGTLIYKQSGLPTAQPTTFLQIAA